MDGKLPSQQRSGRWPTILTLAGLTLLSAVPLPGCGEDDEELSPQGRALRDLDDANGDAWDDFENWFDTTF